MSGLNVVGIAESSESAEPDIPGDCRQQLYQRRNKGEPEQKRCLENPHVDETNRNYFDQKDHGHDEVTARNVFGQAARFRVENIGHRAESGVGQRALMPSVVDIEPRETKSGMLVFDISAAIDDRKLGRSRGMAPNTIQLRLKDTVGCEFWVHPERFKVDEGVHEATTQAEFEGSFEKRFEG